MRAQVQKWGNSLALRIPKTVAADSKIEAGSVVDLSVHKGRLVVAPLSQPVYSLEKLLAGVNKRNLHAEVHSGPPQGREAL
jgi:antitoxin MazE